MLKLWASPTSPFVRKALIVVIEKELSDRVEIAMIKSTPLETHPDLKDDNPLGKLPCLVLDDGTLVIDSRVICQYLDKIGSGPMLHPLDDVRHSTLEAICDGILDCAVAIVYETLMRPTEYSYQPWIESQWGKIERSLKIIEADYLDILEGFNLSTIGLVCVLEYLDFRMDERNWRTITPKLATWLATVNQRPSFLSTRPKA